MKTVQSDSQRLSFNFKSHITMTNENKRAKSVIKVQERKMLIRLQLELKCCNKKNKLALCINLLPKLPSNNKLSKKQKT